MNTTPKKRHEHGLLRWPADAKKKVGVEQGKFIMLGTQMPSFPLSTHVPTKNHNTSSPVRVFFSHRIVYFGPGLRISYLLFWVPFSAKRARSAQ
jgi:hypothetical protein